MRVYGRRARERRNTWKALAKRLRKDRDDFRSILDSVGHEMQNSDARAVVAERERDRLAARVRELEEAVSEAKR
jgi:hypothetical protein